MALKSAVEIAMEKAKRLSGANKALTQEQKQQIAELRRQHTAKLAELEILSQASQAKHAAQGDAEGLTQEKQHLLQEKAKLESKLREAIKQVSG